MKKNIFLLTLIALVIIACDKNENDVLAPEQQALSITVASPVDSVKYHAGDTVWISGVISDPVELHNYSVAIHNAQYDTLVAKVVEGHSHNKTVAVETFWKSKAHDHVDYHMVWKADNHNGQTIEKRVPFHVHPMDGH